MAKRLDKIVVVDIEATCWDGNVVSCVQTGEENSIFQI